MPSINNNNKKQPNEHKAHNQISRKKKKDKRKHCREARAAVKYATWILQSSHMEARILEETYIGSDVQKNGLT